MKHQSILAALLLVGTPMAYAQNSFEDDIYYNPKKAKNTQTKKKESNYIADMSAMDVDTYNRRGEQYYLSPVDTIGTATENGEDFVYTQQIQKYYNPTIVVDNADVLGDVLANAYGNVEIVIDNNGLPVFTPYYGYPYWGSYGGWGLNVSPWGWSVGFYDPWYSWTWGPSWGWGPSWTWGPSWAWGPSWGWAPGWGPSWGWGPGWGPSWGWGPGHNPAPRPPMANWRPQGNRPTGPRPGWSTNTRPGGNYADGNHRVPGGMRPGAASRPGSSTSRPGNNTRPAGSHTGVVNNGGRWEYNTTGTTGHRKAGTGAVNTGRGTNTKGNSVTNSSGSTRRDRVGTNNSNSNSNRNSYNTGNRGTTRNNSGFNSGRSNSSNRGSMGGSRGGGRSTGGGGRSTGGGGRGRR